MPSDDTNFEDELRGLMAAGRKIEAIKQYRAATGVGLADAKDAVEALEHGKALLKSEPVDPEIEDQIVALLDAGRKIVAIKLYRRQTGAGLKEANDLVEALAAKHGISPKGAGCAGMVLLIVLISTIIGVSVLAIKGKWQEVMFSFSWQALCRLPCGPWRGQ